MNIRERYNIEYTTSTFTLYPNKASLQLSWWFLGGMVTGLVVLVFFENYLDKNIFWVIFTLLIYFMLHSLYDVKIGSEIHYIFDASENAVYKKNPFFLRKKIMKLDEAVIFVHSEMGSWYYALGADQSQFIKNYKISEGFSSGQKSLERQKAYENFILNKIANLIENINLELKN